MEFIEIKAPVTGWKKTTPTHAFEFACGRYRALVGVRREYRAQYINDFLLKGISFTDEELRAERRN